MNHYYVIIISGLCTLVPQDVTGATLSGPGPGLAHNRGRDPGSQSPIAPPGASCKGHVMSSSFNIWPLWTSSNDVTGKKFRTSLFLRSIINMSAEAEFQLKDLWIPKSLWGFCLAAFIWIIAKITKSINDLREIFQYFIFQTIYLLSSPVPKPEPRIFPLWWVQKLPTFLKKWLRKMR